MKNPFRKLFRNENDNGKKEKLKEGERMMLNIVKKSMTGSLKDTDMDRFEKYTKEYYALYPDKSGEENAKVKIAKLRQICKV